MFPTWQGWLMVIGCWLIVIATTVLAFGMNW